MFRGSVSGAFSDRLFLYRGAACGFKDTCNNGAELCMGFNPAVECPRGWTRHLSRDWPSGGTNCFFAWCSYDDPNHICCEPGSGPDVCDPSCLAKMPQGMACGIADAVNRDGVCGGLNRVLDSACPSGYQRSNGFWDAGRAAGNGIGWCFKL